MIIFYLLKFLTEFKRHKRRMKTSRRNFISTSTLALSLPLLGFSNEEKTQEKFKESPLKGGDTLLFQGDSITDAGREKTKELPNSPDSLGKGYAFLASAHLLHARADKNLTLYNRGISGNKVYQLQERWQKDAIDLNPKWISILIGVNDYWHKRKHNYEGTLAIYENDYRALLKSTLEALPGVQFILCEPFILPGTSAVDQTWVAPFKEYQQIAKQISEEFNTLWVPFQTVFDQALEQADASYWAPDGVHPSLAGSHLMAHAWMEVFNNR